MRQESSDPKGKNAIAPPSDAQLNQLASDLAGVHPSDFNQLLQTITQFGFQLHPEDRDAPFPPSAPLDGIRKIIELSRTLLVVHPGEVKSERFADFISCVLQMLELAQSYFASIEATAVCRQLERIAASLAIGEVMPVRGHNWFHDKAVLAAAVCLALLLFDLTSDHFPIWQLLAAIALVSGVCPLMYRIGAKHGHVQTPVKPKL